MELEHSFTVPVPKSRAWDVLLDVERVAPCMPGATLDSVDGDEIRGRIKVKVGPINMTYAGTARFIEKDAEAGVVKLEASGKETRGAGTASASVRSVLEDRGEETHVTVLTTLNVTGKPAQFGRGVLNEVGGKLLSIFAANLATTLGETDGAGTGAGAGAPDSAAGAGAEQAASASGTVAGSDQPLDDLKLPARAVSSLGRENITTVSQLATRTEDQLLAIDGIGPASIVDIKAKLADLGLSLGQPAAPGAPPAAAPPAAAPSGAAPSSADTAESAAGAATPVAGPPADETSAAETSAAAPHPPAAREAAHQLEDDAINLLKVAGMPVLKRAIPVLVAVAAALLISLRKKVRRRRR